MALETFGLFMLLLTYSSCITNNRVVCVLNKTHAGSAVCCDNYKEDERGECKYCTAGYFGDFCEKRCPNGKFGERCGGKCYPTCDPEECDHVTGCPSTDTKATSFSTHDENLFTTVQQHSIVSLTTTPPSHLTSTLPTNRTTDQYTVLLSTILTSSTKSNFRNELFLTNHLIVGVGAFIGVLLIVLIIQKCLKSKSAVQNVSKLKSDDHNEAVDFTVKSHDANRKKYIDHCSLSLPLHRDLYDFRNREHVYQQVESDYQDIDQYVKNENAFQGEKLQHEFKEPHFPPHPVDAYLFPILGKEFDDEATSDAYIEPLEQESYIEPQQLQSYLDSPKFHKKDSTDEHRHSYIEVVELDSIDSSEIMHKLSSSCDDAIRKYLWPSVSYEGDGEKDNTYIDAVFS